MFINGDLKSMNRNTGLQKSRLNNIAIVDSVNNIVKQNLEKAPDLTCSISQDGTREPLKLFFSNMSQGLLLNTTNEDIQQIGLSHMLQSSFNNVMRK